MKFDCTFLTKTLVIAAAFISTLATAGNNNSSQTIKNITHQYVSAAMAETSLELSLSAQKDVLTASHHATPDINESTRITSIKINDLKGED